MRTDRDIHIGREVRPTLDSPVSKFLPDAQWLVAKTKGVVDEETGERKLKKPPLKPSDPTDVDAGLTFEEAVYLANHPNQDWQVAGRLESHQLTLVGFMLSSDDDVTMVDWDDVRDPNVGDGSIPEMVLDYVADIGGYVEISPSGTGLKCITRGDNDIPKLLDKHKHKGNLNLDPVGRLNVIPHVECYESQRYTTITGNIFTHPYTWTRYEAIQSGGEPLQRLIEEQLPLKSASTDSTSSRSTTSLSPAKAISNSLTTLGKQSFRRKTNPKTSHRTIDGEWKEINSTPTVAQVWATGCALNEEFRALWYGETAGHDTISEADAALVSHLWYYAKDWNRVHEAFKESKLYGIRSRKIHQSDRYNESQPKWDRPSYRKRTMEKTKDNSTPGYEGSYLDPTLSEQYENMS